jgi:cyclic pyranopterin phosphate synthase
MCLRDIQQRTFEYFRVSVTEGCDLRCSYCVPQNDIEISSRLQVLSDDELVQIVSIASDLGLKKLRLTGGEPLLRPGLDALCRRLKTETGIQKLHLTTNGQQLLKHWNSEFLDNIDGINFSLDSLSADRFYRITGGGELEKTLDAIRHLSETNIRTKINVVALNDLSEEEFLEFVRFSKDHKIQVRFIEFMPLCGDSWAKEKVLGMQTLMDWLRGRFHLDNPSTDGVAEVYGLENGAQIGFIAALSSPFCSSCNRMRLSSVGELCPCLFSDAAIPLRPLLDENADKTKFVEAFVEAARMKDSQVATQCSCGSIKQDGNLKIRKIGG